MGPKVSLGKINNYLELKSNENKHTKICGKKEGKKERGREEKGKERREEAKRKIFKDGIFAKVIGTNLKGLPVAKLK